MTTTTQKPNKIPLNIYKNVFKDPIKNIVLIIDENV